MQLLLAMVIAQYIMHIAPSHYGARSNIKVLLLHMPLWQRLMVYSYVQVVSWINRYLSLEAPVLYDNVIRLYRWGPGLTGLSA